MTPEEFLAWHDVEWAPTLDDFERLTDIAEQSLDVVRRAVRAARRCNISDPDPDPSLFRSILRSATESLMFPDDPNRQGEGVGDRQIVRLQLGSWLRWRDTHNLGAGGEWFVREKTLEAWLNWTAAKASQLETSFTIRAREPIRSGSAHGCCIHAALRLWAENHGSIEDAMEYGEEYHPRLLQQIGGQWIDSGIDHQITVLEKMLAHERDRAIEKLQAVATETAEAESTRQAQLLLKSEWARIADINPGHVPIDIELTVETAREHRQGKRRKTNAANAAKASEVKRVKAAKPKEPPRPSITWRCKGPLHHPMSGDRETCDECGAALEPVKINR